MAVALKQSKDLTFARPGQDRQQQLGQFFTAQPVADFMASLFQARWSELDFWAPELGQGHYQPRWSNAYALAITNPSEFPLPPTNSTKR